MHVLRSPPPTFSAYSFAVIRVDASRASLSASGELDLAALDDLTELMESQAVAGRTFIRLDLSGVTLLDCSCLSALVAMHHRLRAASGQLILTSASGPVVRLLSLTHLQDTLLTTTGLESAVDLTPWPRLVPAQRAVLDGAEA